MSIRTITNYSYKGVSELYYKSDAKVTGYYITTRDTDAIAVRKELIRMYLYKKMEILLFVMLVTLLTGCGGGSGGSSIQAVETTLASKAVQQGHITDSLTGEPLANVEVSTGSQIATTDTDGFYTLSNLIETEEAVINFKKEGYLLGSTKIQIKELSGNNTPSTNYLEYTMHAKNYQWDYNSNDEVSGSHILIDASVSYESINRKSYNGINTAELIYFDIISSEGKTAFPGAFKGINSNGTIVQFETYGLISVTLKDSNGNTLHFAEGETATLRFDAVSSLEKPDTLPLWNYDYDQGLWFEEGYAQLQGNGSYKGEISHLGTWSLNKPLEEEVGIYRGRIISEDGSPISDVRLQAIGNNWISSDLSTDEDGVFEIEVKPGEDFKLKAYHYEDKYAAESGTISAVASGEIVEI